MFRFIHRELVINYPFFQFVVLFGVAFMTMFVDELNSDLSGKEFIFVTLFWKQLS